MLQRADALAPMFGRQLEGPSGAGVQLPRRISAEQRRRDARPRRSLQPRGIGPVGGQQDVRLRRGDRGQWHGRCARDWRKCCSTKPCTRPIGAKPSGRAVSSSRLLGCPTASPSTRHGGWTPPARVSSTFVDRRLPPTGVGQRAGCRARGPSRCGLTWQDNLPTVANVLYMTRVTQSVESGFRLATGPSFKIWPWTCRPSPPSSPRGEYAALFPPFQDRKTMRKAGRSLGPMYKYGLCPGSRTPDSSSLRAAWRRSPRTSAANCAWARWTWKPAPAPGTPHSGHRLNRLDNELPTVGLGAGGPAALLFSRPERRPTWAW